MIGSLNKPCSLPHVPLTRTVEPSPSRSNSKFSITRRTGSSRGRGLVCALASQAAQRGQASAYVFKFGTASPRTEAAWLPGADVPFRLRSTRRGSRG